MDRRHFLLASAAAVTLPLPSWAGGKAPIAYAPGVLEEHLAAGHVVFLDFKAEWCGTCKTQERVMNKLKAENPAYAQKITFINVDWDKYGEAEISTSMNIPRRSTLVVLKGDQELGRLVAATGETDIKALMDTALAAAG